MKQRNYFMINWEETIEHMKKGVVIVTFLKADNSVREMECTLADYLLPETHTTREPNDDVVVVYDIKVEGWRSFRKERVLFVEVL